jgi:hypothetical protein
LFTPPHPTNAPRGKAVPTIQIHQAIGLTPEQYITGLTDFSPGRSKVFSHSADDYLEVHSLNRTEADVTEGSGSVWERLHYDWSDPRWVVVNTTASNVWDTSSGYAYFFKALPDRRTYVHLTIVRVGKNTKGRLLALALGTVAKGVLVKAFDNSVKALEARNDGGPA